MDNFCPCFIIISAKDIHIILRFFPHSIKEKENSKLISFAKFQMFCCLGKRYDPKIDLMFLSRNLSLVTKSEKDHLNDIENYNLFLYCLM